jgi:choline kinase
MTAIILAAGRSTRLYPVTKEMPKCLLEIGGRTILDRTIDALQSAGVESIVIVVGFQKEKIVGHIRNRPMIPAIRCVENSDYATTNNASSLLCAAGETGEILLLDSDIVFDPLLVSMLRNSRYDACCALRSQGSFGSEEIKVTLVDGNRVSRIGKDIPLAQAAGESVGIERFSSSAALRLFETLEKRIRLEHRTSEFYEASFQQMIDEGIPFHAVDIGPLKCIEVDTEEDLREAQRIFGSDEEIRST